MNANKFIQLLKDNSGVSYNMVTKEYTQTKVILYHYQT